MKRATLILAAVALMLCSAALVQAGAITYTEQATATGTLGSSAFNSALVTITFVGDTTNVVCGGGFCYNAVGTATVNVAGVGTAAFTSDTYRAFDNQGAIAVGIADESSGASILDTYDSAFGTYDLTTAIGPVTDASFIRPDVTFSTDLGGFNLQSVGDSTFTATTGIPEPATLAPFGAGLAVLSLLRKRVRR
jgi:hypothetical protein